MHRAALALIVISLTSCSSDSDKLDQAEKNIKSWEATMKLAADEWREMKTPTVHFRETITAANEELDDQQEELNEYDNPRANELKSRLKNLKSQIAEMSAAAEHDHRGELRS